MRTKLLTAFVFTLLLTTSLSAQKTVKASQILDDIKQGKNVSYENESYHGIV